MDVPKLLSAPSHRRRYNGISLGPGRPTTAKSPSKGKWKHIRDPLAKRSPQPAFPVENGYRRTIRQALVAACEQENLVVIKEAIQAFERSRLEDKGDLTNAKEKVEFLNLRRGLFDAIHRRRIETLDKAIASAKNSRFVEMLDPFPLKKAENLRDELSCLDQYYHPILLLNQRTISELRRYTNPPDVIKSTMAAAFLLLGENEDEVMDWDFILGLLGRIGNGSVKLKMEHFDASRVSKEKALLAETFLTPVTINSVRQASFGCAAFFLWAKKAIEDVKKEGDPKVSIYESEI